MTSDRAPAIPVARRIFHVVATSFTTLLALAMPEHPYMLLIGGGALLGLTLDVSRPRIAALNRLHHRVVGFMLKESEATEITGATWFLIAAFFAFFFYGPAVAIPALMFVAVGDPAAALVGPHLPGPRFRGKSPLGGVAFILASAAAWAVIAGLGFGEWSWAVVVGLLVAAAVELAALPPDDNLTVPLLAGAAMVAAQSAGL